MKFLVLLLGLVFESCFLVVGVFLGQHKIRVWLGISFENQMVFILVVLVISWIVFFRAIIRAKNLNDSGI